MEPTKEEKETAHDIDAFKTYIALIKNVPVPDCMGDYAKDKSTEIFAMGNSIEKHVKQIIEELKIKT